jgi:hypothetical protein
VLLHEGKQHRWILHFGREVCDDAGEVLLDNLSQEGLRQLLHLLLQGWQGLDQAGVIVRGHELSLIKLLDVAELSLPVHLFLEYFEDGIADGL